MNITLFAKTSFFKTVYTTQQTLNCTYIPRHFSPQNLDTIKIFEKNLITNSKRLDEDISELINDNIMDLLS